MRMKVNLKTLTPVVVFFSILVVGDYVTALIRPLVGANITSALELAAFVVAVAGFLGTDRYIQRRYLEVCKK